MVIDSPVEFVSFVGLPGGSTNQISSLPRPVQ